MLNLNTIITRASILCGAFSLQSLNFSRCSKDATLAFRLTAALFALGGSANALELTDAFASRPTSSAKNVTYNGSLVSASHEVGEPRHWQGATMRSVWGGWAAPSNGLVTISTEGSDFSTTLSVYSGDMKKKLTYK